MLELEQAQRPDLAGSLRTIAAVGPSPIPPVVVARKLAAPRKTRLQELFFGMSEDSLGRAISQKAG